MADSVGAWSHHPENPPGEQWTWVPGGTAEPGLEQEYGYEAITNPARDPAGELNYGSWRDASSGENADWVWEWGQDPDGATVNEFGFGAATDPTRTPTGAPVFEPDADPPYSPVPMPVLTNGWPGGVPDIIGRRGTPSGPGSDEPPPAPTVPHFVVSMGDVRNDVEIPLQRAALTCVDTYNRLVAMVNEARSFRSYRDQGGFAAGPSVAEIYSGMTSLVLATANIIDLASFFNDCCNAALQNYADADVRSRLPDSNIL